jgi:ATP-binding cassette, subfamily B, bacterial
MLLNTYTNMLKKYLRPQVGGMFLLAVLLAGSILLSLAGPQVIRFFLDTATAGETLRLLLIAALIFVGLSLGQQVVDLGSLYAAENLGWKTTNLLRRDLLLHCLRLDMDFHKQHTPGELIERVDGDVTELATFFSSFLINLVGHALLVLGILVMLFREDLRVGVVLSVYVLVVLGLLGSLHRFASSRWGAARQAAAETYGYIEERLSGAEEIRAAGAESYVMSRLYELMRRITRTHRAAWLTAALTANAASLVFAVGSAAGLGLGVYLYLQGQASLGAAYLIVAYVGMLSTPLQQIRAQVQDLQRASASIARIQELFGLSPRVQDPEADHARPALRRSGGAAVQFEQVSFAYEDHSTVLHEVNFSLPPGRVLGVLGRTGGGKTTLTRLLFRLYDPASGTVRLDGRDLRDLPLDELRSSVGMVTQDVQLFQASLRDNLAFFDPGIPDERIYQALDALGIRAWVDRLPKGLNALVKSGGEGFSAGEAQLLAFTRVFLKDPGTVILDEASSRLDPVTEALLERAVTQLLEGRTALIIAHRLATVHRADDILILENGRVVEYGPRVELAADPASRFARLLQVGMEEALA